VAIMGCQLGEDLIGRNAGAAFVGYLHRFTQGFQIAQFVVAPARTLAQRPGRGILDVGTGIDGAFRRPRTLFGPIDS
jgi:hypothetical protein